MKFQVSTDRPSQLGGGNAKRLRSLILSTRHLQVNRQQVRQRYENLGIGMAFHGLSVQEKKKENESTHTVGKIQKDSVEYAETNVSKNFLSWILRVSCRDADLHEELHLLEQDIQVCHHFKPPAVSKKGYCFIICMHSCQSFEASLAGSG